MAYPILEGAVALSGWQVQRRENKRAEAERHYIFALEKTLGGHDSGIEEGIQKVLSAPRATA